MSNTFTQVFGGTTIYPSDVTYLPITLSANLSLEWPLENAGGSNLVARIMDVTPTGIYSIAMPDATLTGVGQTVLFNNLGPYLVTITNYVGTALLSIPAGTQWQLYLTNNTSAAGVWRTFQYGATTAQAQASTLAGYGIVAIGSTLAQSSSVSTVSASPYSLGAADRASTYVWTGALGTFNLPDAASLGNNWFFNIRNAGTGDLTIDPAGADTINGALTLTLSPADSAVIVTDGTRWYTIGLGQQAVFAFDYTVISLAGLGNPSTVTTYTLSGSELNRISYKFTGAVLGDIRIVVPFTVQQYWIDNSITGGSYNLTVATSGGTPLTVIRNTRGIYYCNGTDVIKADSSTGIATPLAIVDGGTGATTSLSALTNLGGTVIGRTVFTAATTATALTALGAAASGVNTDISDLDYASGIVVGSPTGGALGFGKLNATGLYINGSAIGTGSGSVTSVQAAGGTTGMTFSGGPITTSGTLTLGGTLAVANGGTGQTTYTDGQLLIGNTTGNTLTKATLTAGSGITITNGTGSITIASTSTGGTVTSVSGAGGSTGLTLTGGPITTSGTLTLGGTLALASGGTGAATASGARTNLGLGTMSTQDASAVAITGGTISGAALGSDLAFSAAYSPASVYSAGYRGVPQIGGAAKTASYTFVLADAAGHVYFTGSTASQTMTIPANASVAYPIGTVLSVVNNSSVTLSVAITTDTLKLAGSGTTGTRTLAVGAVATCIKVASTTWFISGAGVT